MNLVPNKQLILIVPNQSTKLFSNKELCVDSKVQKTIGDVFCPTCRNEKCVSTSTNKTTSFYVCKKACCHVLNFAFKDQKPTIMLSGGDGTHCFAKKTSRDYKKEAFPLWRKFLRQLQPCTSNFEPEKVKNFSFYGIIVSTPHWLIQLNKISFTLSFDRLSVYIKVS